MQHLENTLPGDVEFALKIHRASLQIYLLPGESSLCLLHVSEVLVL